MCQAVTVWLKEGLSREDEEGILLKKIKQKVGGKEKVFFGPVKAWVSTGDFSERIVLRVAQWEIWQAFKKNSFVSRPIEIARVNFSFFRNGREYQGVRIHFLVLFQLKDSGQGIVSSDHFFLRKEEFPRFSFQKKNSRIFMFPEELEIFKKEIWPIQRTLS